MEAPMRIAVITTWVIAACLLLAVPAAQAESCSGKVAGQLMSKKELDDSIEWRFAVEVHASGSACSYVEFDFVTEETKIGGKKKKSSKAMTQKVRSTAEKARLVTHRVPKDATLSTWEFKYTGCRPCPKTDN